MVLAAVARHIDRGALGCQGDTGERGSCAPPPQQEPPKRPVVGGEQPGEGESRKGSADGVTVVIRNYWFVFLWDSMRSSAGGGSPTPPLCGPQLKQRVTMDAAAGGGGWPQTVSHSRDPSRRGGAGDAALYLCLCLAPEARSCSRPRCRSQLRAPCPDSSRDRHVCGTDHPRWCPRSAEQRGVCAALPGTARSTPLSPSRLHEWVGEEPRRFARARLKAREWGQGGRVAGTQRPRCQRSAAPPAEPPPRAARGSPGCPPLPAASTVLKKHN